MILSPQSKKARKVGRVVKRTLADGSIREYRYKAYKQKVSPRLERDSLAALTLAFKGSPAWRALAPKTAQWYARYLMPLDTIGHFKATDVTRRIIIEIRDAIAGSRGNGAALAFASSASALFSWAVSCDWITHSPVYKIPPLASGSWPAWTFDQGVEALKRLPEHYRRVVVLGLYTGQRRGDLVAMKWAAYDGVCLTVKQQKTGTVVVLNVQRDLKAELDAWRAEATQETILLNSEGNPFKATSLSTCLPREMQKIGIPKGLNVHGMRKLFAAGMAERGATTHEIASQTGHKTLSMIQHYTASADQRKLSETSSGKIQSFTNALQPIEKG